MEWHLKILGSSSALPTDVRMLSSQLLTTHSHHFLFDCGEGTQFQIRRFGASIFKIDTIFLSHLHGDHLFGLFGLLSTLHMYSRIKPLRIFGQKGIQAVVDMVLQTANTKIDFPLEIIELQPNEFDIIFEDYELKVYTVPLRHSVDSSGFYVVQKQGKRNIKKEFVESHDIDFSWFPRIQNGEDYLNEKGQLFKNKDITKPPANPKTYAYISDTAYLPEIAKYLKGVDLLYHEATFAEEHQEDARAKLHSTAKEAARIALSAQAKKLIIGHFSTRYSQVDKLLQEARDIFQNTDAACDGMDIKF